MAKATKRVSASLSSMAGEFVRARISDATEGLSQGEVVLAVDDLLDQQGEAIVAEFHGPIAYLKVDWTTVDDLQPEEEPRSIEVVEEAFTVFILSPSRAAILARPVRLSTTPDDWEGWPFGSQPSGDPWVIDARILVR